MPEPSEYSRDAQVAGQQQKQEQVRLGRDCEKLDRALGAAY